MNTKFKVAVIGSTGKSGKYVLLQLLSKGYACKLLLRDPSRYNASHPDVEIIKGDARNATSIRELIKDCDVVVSTLGQPKGEPSIFSEATANILSAMKTFNVKRYIVTTGLNVDTPSDKKTEKTKAATDWMKANYTETTTDKQKEYEMLVKSDTLWTLIRLPVIELTSEHKEINVSLVDCPGSAISAADLASFIVTELTQNEYLKEAPFIAN